MEHKTLGEIMHNCMIKTYPDGLQEVTACPSALFRERGYEDASKWKPDSRRAVGVNDEAANLERAKRRARTMIRDLARSNDFRYFVTLTLSADKVTNRYDVASVITDITRWLDNRVRRKGLLYVLVAEEHKDGGIHFHGFMNDALAVVDSGTLCQGGNRPRKPRSKRQRAAWISEGWHVVYNIPEWGYGFTTAIELYGERDKAIGYTCKYISKAEKKLGGRWYYHGGRLQLPSVSYEDVDDWESFAAEHSNSQFTLDSLGITMIRYLRRRDNDG